MFSYPVSLQTSQGSPPDSSFQHVVNVRYLCILYHNNCNWFVIYFHDFQLESCSFFYDASQSLCLGCICDFLKQITMVNSRIVNLAPFCMNVIEIL